MKSILLSAFSIICMTLGLTSLASRMDTLKNVSDVRRVAKTDGNQNGATVNGRSIPRDKQRRT